MKYFKYSIQCLLLLSLAAVFSGCSVDAIWVSRPALDFSLDESPMYFDVANNNADLGTITVNITTSKNWIKVAPQTIPCKPPTETGLQRERIEVRIDRRLIDSKGKHSGEITLRASGVKKVTLKVSVVQGSVSPTLTPLNITNPKVTYEKPSLIEFAFSLRDEDGHAVTEESTNFQVKAFENQEPVDTSAGLSLRSGRSRQLWLSLVLDYSVNMAEIPDAFEEMERVATEVLLPSLNDDALVSVSAFYRETESSREIVPFTVDRAFTTEQIQAIRTHYLTGFRSRAAIYDALDAAIEQFPEDERTEKDDRYIVLFCNGRDFTRVPPMEVVRDKALKKNVQIYVACLGDTMDADKLITLARATNGRFVAADSLDTLEAAFERIVEDLQGQYIVRWASARADTNSVIPSFSLILDGATASYKAPNAFIPSRYLGDRMKGELLLVQSEAPGQNTTVFLRAHYVPWGIDQLQFLVHSDYNYSVALVDFTSDALLAGWNLDVEDAGPGEKYITVTTDRDYIPFAAFGPMLHFVFTAEVDDPFTYFIVEDPGYTDGQEFVFLEPAPR
ncbi:MAG: hypothetical protein GX130_13595 [Candidatus Hydrogenedens sp.]|jgi:hypothetical protein|nr:hypothetical protein [Candidatus Hydrogenedens sp.]